MTYKGKSVEFQRVKGKKAPKIQTLDSDDVEAPETSQKANEALKETFQGYF